MIKRMSGPDVFAGTFNSDEATRGRRLRTASERDEYITKAAMALARRRSGIRIRDDEKAVIEDMWRLDNGTLAAIREESERIERKAVEDAKAMVRKGQPVMISTPPGLDVLWQTMPASVGESAGKWYEALREYLDQKPGSERTPPAVENAPFPAMSGAAPPAGNSAPMVPVAPPRRGFYEED